ncbi:fatty acyl-AMP ligase [Plantactinospora endophytica]|uniref:Polyketide synthase n=1 Tax=Plantactinospora endophytica TaxID=673535 RepID=A0ABQ4EAS1_9ACTN|nr:fatty acyl-AMP ligase [Plantactinospora endophytica]GIG91759.1 polyketide synthase [Plantactinospora endophytica]
MDVDRTVCHGNADGAVDAVPEKAGEANVSEWGSIVEAVRHNVAGSPERQAVVFCRGAGERFVETSLTYADLDRVARATARWLGRRCRPGDRALLLYPTGLEFVAGFLGCLYAGVIPVPVPLPANYRHHADRTSAIARNADVAAVLTDPANLRAVDDWMLQEGLDHLAFAATDTAAPGVVIGADAPPGTGTTTGDAGPTTGDAGAAGGAGPVPDGPWRPYPARPDDIAFLQYTSGSTSDPKGVMVTHGNVLHNIGSVHRTLGWTDQTRFCSWLPLYHDMGLIAMLIAPLLLGSTAVLIRPNDFLKRPHLWLEAIDRYGAEVACAPNFAYDLCARLLTDEQVAGLDLSRWKYACNGAEPIDPATLDRFAARFAPAGFRYESFLPTYGLAEATLCVTGARPAGRPVTAHVDPVELARDVFAPLPDGTSAGLALVGSGRVNALDVRIVDPGTCAVLPDGRVGEVWIRGGSVTRGYWGDPVATRRAFGAVTADGDGGFLRTGDLGTFDDGELYVTGRIKEMMIVHGRNLYPHDVEREVREVAEAFAGLPCAVFSVPSPREEIIVVQELRTRGRDAAEVTGLAAAVKATLSRILGVRVANVVFVRVGQVRRTTSGKIQRTMMRELFVSGVLDATYEELDPEVRDRYRPARAGLPVPAGRG